MTTRVCVATCWATVEGRLMKMLDQHPELTLEFLNTATQPCVDTQ